MNNILCLTPVYKRHKALNIYAKNHHCNPDDVVTICSNEPDQIECLHYGYDVVTHPNDPMGEKRQAGLERCRHRTDWKWLLSMGADNVMCKNAWGLLQQDDTEMIVFEDMYYYDINTGQCIYWGGYNNGRMDPAGAGKLISRSFLNEIDFQVWTGCSRGNGDSVSWSNLKDCTSIRYVNCRRDGIFLVDFKDGEGITTIEDIMKTGDCDVVTESERNKIESFL